MPLVSMACRSDSALAIVYVDYLTCLAKEMRRRYVGQSILGEEDGVPFHSPLHTDRTNFRRQPSRNRHGTEEAPRAGWIFPGLTRQSPPTLDYQVSYFFQVYIFGGNYA